MSRATVPPRVMVTRYCERSVETVCTEGASMTDGIVLRELLVAPASHSSESVNDGFAWAVSRTHNCPAATARDQVEGALVVEKTN